MALVSGGLDSCCLLKLLGQRSARVVPLYVRCGFLWETVERMWLARMLKALNGASIQPLQTVEVPMRSLYGAHWSLTGRGMPLAHSRDAAVYLPGRNVMLIGAAAIRAAQQRIATVALGTLGGNPFGDAQPAFVSRFAECLTQALGAPLQIVMPLRQWTKAQLIRTCADAPFELTFSCLRPQGSRHCGRCNKCAERRRAFRAARIPDPTRYA